MRLHRIEITAFGPFAGTATVDFDALGSAGLFLLSGPTGAGKSSVLDAVCFALYGEVPGDRATARHLRSDAAAPDLAPRIVLELTLGERRLRLTRSPAWDRPKRRGEGTTRQQASVLVQQRESDESWTHLTHRMDEAGQLMSRLLGLTLNQFCQVVLLPQGGFQQFLRADAKDRQRLLQSIFRTGRFGDIERWLGEHRLNLRASSLTAQSAIGDVVSRLSETAESAPPATRFDQPAGDPALVEVVETEDGSNLPPLPHWAQSVTRDASEAAGAAEAIGAAAQERYEAVTTALEEAARTARLQEAGTRAGNQVEALAARAGAIDRARQRRDRALRAAPVGGLIAAHTSAAAAALSAQRAWRAAVAALGPAAQEAEGTLPLDFGETGETSETGGAGSSIDAATAQRALDDLSTRRVRFLDAAASQSSLDALQARHAERTALLATLGAELDALRSDAAELPTVVSAARDDVAERREARAGLAATRSKQAAAIAGLEAARQVVELERLLAAAQTDHESARSATVAAKENWLELAERRVVGMASELAHQLAVGGACPVCGSCEHPSPARAQPGAPDAAQEKAARRAVDDAEFTQQNHAEQVRALRERLASQRTAASGRSVDEWAEELSTTTSSVERLTALTDGLAAAETASHAAEARLSALEETLRASERRLDTLTAEHAAAEQQICERARQVSDLLASEGAPTVAAALASIEHLIDRWEAVVAASGRHRHSVEVAHRAEAAAREAAADAGFDDVAAARAALLPTHEIEQHERAVREHDEAMRAARATLEDPAVAAALARPPTDLAAARADVADAEQAWGRARTSATLARRRAIRLVDLHADLTAAVAAWEPVRQAYDVADRMATLASGRSSDNPRSLTLSAYVLAWRLGQVIAAANERLGPMTAQRYALEQRAGGLDLDVRDEWTGESRAPATLSGGETFLVSLALALGLADVVLAESAADGEGSDLETLFIDEGFGALDADTLDDVMGVLDGLRDGGRVVGVVSHVAELRTRIGTQLHVTASRSGSAVRIVHADA